MHVLEKHVVWKGLLEKSAPQRYNSIEFSYPANVRIGLIRRMEAVKRIQLPCGLLFPPLQSYAGRGQQLESYLYATHLTMITSISLLSVTKTLWPLSHQVHLLNALSRYVYQSPIAPPSLLFKRGEVSQVMTSRVITKRRRVDKTTVKIQANSMHDRRFLLHQPTLLSCPLFCTAIHNVITGRVSTIPPSDFVLPDIEQPALITDKRESLD